MKINFEHQLLYNHYLKRFHTAELYLKRFDSVRSDFEKYEILDEIHELFLFLQDEIYQIGRSKQFELYLSLLKDIKKYSMLDKYLNDRLFWNLYYSSYKKYFELVNEISELSKYDIQFLKPMQNIHEEYCKQVYDFEKSKFLSNLDKKYISIQENMVLLGEKWDKRLIVSILKELKNLMNNLDTESLVLGVGIIHDETYNLLIEKAVLKINTIINDKVELALCLHELNNKHLFLESYYEVASLRDVIRIINPIWLSCDSDLALHRLEKVAVTSQKVTWSQPVLKNVGFFRKRNNLYDTGKSIIDDLIKLPTESEIENIVAIASSYGLDFEEVMVLITERQANQKSLFLNRLCFFDRNCEKKYL